MRGIAKALTGYSLSRGAVLMAAALILCLSFAAPQPAFAQCEAAADATAAFPPMQDPDITNINLLIEQEVAPIEGDNLQTGGFAPNLIRSALKQLVNYFHDFAKNITEALTGWATPDFNKSLKDMTAELHTSQIDQSYQLGMLADAQLMVEEKSRHENKFTDAHRRYIPSELACEINSTGPGAERAFQISRALNRTLSFENMPRHGNSKDGISGGGKGGELRETWTEYQQKFCDNTMGDVGCNAPGTIAGTQRDLPVLLWGNKQTIDGANPDNLLIIQAALRYFVDPLAPDPIPPTAAVSLQGHRGLLERRSELAFVNTIYNTLGAMLSERIGGSGVDVQLLRAAVGVPPEHSSPNASYREIQEAMTRDRFSHPEYMVRMIGDPVQVIREQETLNALRLQTMNDLYRRSEEMLFMESAEYGRDLNSQLPSAAIKDVPF